MRIVRKYLRRMRTLLEKLSREVCALSNSQPESCEDWPDGAAPRLAASGRVASHQQELAGSSKQHYSSRVFPLTFELEGKLSALIDQKFLNGLLRSPRRGVPNHVVERLRQIEAEIQSLTRQ